MRTPSYRLHRPSGRAVVTLNGRDYYLGPHGSPESKREYERLIGQWKQARGSVSFGIAKPDISIGMLICDYLEHCRIYYPSDDTNSELYQNKLALRNLEAHAETLVSQFGPLLLKSIRQKLVEKTSEQTGRKLSRQYINKTIGRIVAMFRWGVENELVSAPIYQALKAVRGLQMGRSSAPESARVMPVSDEQINKTLEHCPPAIAAMIRLQRLTGMRPGEVCRLTPRMVDRTDKIWAVTFDEHKNAHRGLSRTAYLGPQAQGVLKKYLSRNEDTYCFSPVEVMAWRSAQRNLARTTPLNQGNRQGYTQRTRARLPSNRRPIRDHYDTQSYASAIRYACAKAFPIPDGATREEAANWRSKKWWNPNQLRHAAATVIRREYGLEAAQVMLGHTKASTTEIYAEVDHSRARAIAGRLG
ncbi:MAG TPA: integrase [Planctomycetaceae bacterium]|nr:integrase [Planctomycetaceae bacterium]